MSAHPSPEKIRDFLLGVEGELPAGELRDHLAACPECAGVAAREAELEHSLWELRQEAAICPACERVAEPGEDPTRCAQCGVAITAGEYKIVTVLVQTNHGRLYLAEAPDGRRVALKEMVFAQVPGLEILEAFEREAKILKQLDHPQIPRLFDSFQVGEGVHTRLYLAQDYIEGTSLLRRMDFRRFNEAEVKAVAAQVLRVLAYLQSLAPPVFHRDIKPANLIRKPDGRVVIVDFGAARDLGTTQGATLVGTYGYMPAEQLGGIVDKTTDLYALGASLVQLLTRRPPWKLLGRASMARRLEVSRPFRRFIVKLVETEPGKRFADATEALDALGKLPMDDRPRELPLKKILGVLAAAAIAAPVGYGLFTGAEVPAAFGPGRQRTSGYELDGTDEVDGPRWYRFFPEMIWSSSARGVYRYQREQARLAREQRRAAAVRPGSTSRPELAKQLCSAGDEFMKHGRYIEAEAAFKSSLRADPSFTDAHHSLGVVLELLGRMDEAADHYRRYLEVRPHARDAEVLRAFLRNHDQEPRRAEQQDEKRSEPVDDIPQFATQDAKALYNAGNRFILQSRFAEAIDQLRLALVADPEFADAHRALGICYARLGKSDQAVAAYERYLKARPYAQDAPKVQAILNGYRKNRDQSESSGKSRDRVRIDTQAMKRLLRRKGLEISDARLLWPNLVRRIEDLRTGDAEAKRARAQLEEAIDGFQFDRVFIRMKLKRAQSGYRSVRPRLDDRSQLSKELERRHLELLEAYRRAGNDAKKLQRVNSLLNSFELSVKLAGR